MDDAKLENDIVEAYRIGNTTIQISNIAYINRTPEEIEKILQRVTAVGWEIAESARVDEKDI